MVTVLKYIELHVREGVGRGLSTLRLRAEIDWDWKRSTVKVPCKISRRTGLWPKCRRAHYNHKTHVQKAHDCGRAMTLWESSRWAVSVRPPLCTHAHMQALHTCALTRGRTPPHEELEWMGALSSRAGRAGLCADGIWCTLKRVLASFLERVLILQWVEVNFIHSRESFSAVLSLAELSSKYWYILLGWRSLGLLLHFISSILPWL